MDSLSQTVPGSPIRVFLLIENRLLREALIRLFRKRPDLLVVGQGGHAEATRSQVLESQFDVLLLDSLETGCLAANFCSQSEAHAAFETVLIGMEADEEQFMTAVRSGVTGYLLKDASSSEVITAVRAVFRGEAVCPSRLCFMLLRLVALMARALPAQSATSRPDLTLRQQQLVALIAKGLTNKEIASLLNISQFTVRNHIHRILKQVDAGNRTEAVETIRACGYAIRT
jgi:DNA-binding NarL/FixJ family response regulator